MDAIWSFPYERFLDLPVVAAIPGEDGDAFQADVVEYGRNVIRLSEVTEVQQFIESNARDVLGWVIDVALLKQVSTELARVLESVPVVAAGREPTLPERMKLVELGVDGYLPLAGGAQAVIDLLVERFAARTSRAIRVLGVTDDRSNQRMGFLADAGRDAGFSCRLTTPKTMFAEIPSFRPELIVVDGRMTKVDVEGLAIAAAQIGRNPRFALICKPLGVENPTDLKYVPAKTITVVSPDAEKVVQTVKAVCPVFRSRGVQARMMKRLSGVGLYGVEAYLEGQLGLLSEVVVKAARHNSWVVVCHLAGASSPAESRLLSDRVTSELLSAGGEVLRVFLVSNDQFVVFVAQITSEVMNKALRAAVGPVSLSGANRTRFYAGAAAVCNGNVTAGMSTARKALIRAEVYAGSSVEIAVA